MANGIRCCANCFWNISSDDVEEILRNESIYEDNDPNYPEAGCGLGLPDNVRSSNNYYCQEHSYIGGAFHTYVLYDERFLSPGYFIISELNNQIAMYAKFYNSNQGFPFYNVRAFEKGAVDQDNGYFRSIDIPIYPYQDKKLFDAVERLYRALKKESITTIDPSRQGKSQFQVLTDGLDYSLSFAKDVSGVRNATDFVDIAMGDHMLCKYYEALDNFYKALASTAVRETKENDIQKILKMTI